MKPFAIAFFILKSLLGERATALFGVMAAIFLALSLSLSNVDIAVKYRLLEDALIASQTFMMSISALFYAFLAMDKERKGGIFVFALSSGATRYEYLTAQFATLFALLSCVSVLFLSVDFVFLTGFAGGMSLEFFTKLLMSGMSASMLAFLTLTLARFVSNTNAMIYAIFLFFIGNGADELYLYAFDAKNPVLSSVVWLVYYCLPNFSFFDTFSLSVHYSKELFSILYFLFYSLLLFLLSLYKFKREILRVG